MKIIVEGLDLNLELTIADARKLYNQLKELFTPVMSIPGYPQKYGTITITNNPPEPVIYPLDGTGYPTTFGKLGGNGTFCSK